MTNISAFKVSITLDDLKKTTQYALGAAIGQIEDAKRDLDNKFRDAALDKTGEVSPLTRVAVNRLVELLETVKVVSLTFDAVHAATTREEVIIEH